MTSPIASENLSAFEVALCGALAGVTSRFVIAPLDVIKIRLQLQTHRQASAARWLAARGKLKAASGQQPVPLQKYVGMRQGMRLIAREEGIRALWKGNLSAEFLYLTYSTVQFVTYNELSLAFAQHETAARIIPPRMQSFVLGALCGTIATITTYPFDLLRTRFAAQGETKIYSGIIHATRQIMAEEGVQGLYRGISPTVVQIIPYMGLVFGINDLMKTAFRRLKSKKRFASIPVAVEDTISGAVAGIVGKTGAFPMDLVRKRLQTQGPSRTHYVIANIPIYPSNIIRCIREIVRNEGVLGLYKGITPALIKSGPASAVTFLIYGWTRGLLESQK